MQVILLEPVRNLGAVGQQVNVKSGYARNFLIPNRKALRATKDNIAYFEARKSEIEKSQAEVHSEAQKLADSINGTIVTVIEQAAEDGRLYGSVNAAVIANAVKAATGKPIDRKHVTLHNPIKTIGFHAIELHLHGDIAAKIQVNVARTTEEAKEAESIFKKGGKVEGNKKKAKADAEALEAEAAAKPAATEAAPEAE